MRVMGLARTMGSGLKIASESSFHSDTGQFLSRQIGVVPEEQPH